MDDRLAVGFFKRLRGGGQSGAAEALTLHAAGTVEVVGESFRQDVLERVAKIATGPEPYLEGPQGPRSFEGAESEAALVSGCAIPRARQSS